MNAEQKGIAILLKSAITGEKYDIPEGFSLEEAQALIRKQGLATLVYDGAYHCGVSPREPVMAGLQKMYYQVLLHSERQMQKVGQIFAAFEENGIDYLPFKGCVMKELYPKPELRTMGDADILIRFDQYPRIKPIMVSLGFELETESDCELIWKCRDLYLELHKCMVQPSHRDYYAYFGDGWGKAAKLDGHRYGFSPEDMFVYLFMHFAKHYRSGGIGCRHVLDLWVYTGANPGLDRGYILGELEKLRLREFYENTCRMMAHWFGDGPEDDVTAFMTKRIFSGGSWGNSRDYYIFTELTKAKDAGQVKNSRLGYAVRLLFPSLKLMRKKYPVLEKWPVLLPVFWVVRGMTVLLHKREKIGENVRIAQMVSDEALSAHQDALRYVGLEFCP